MAVGSSKETSVSATYSSLILAEAYKSHNRPTRLMVIMPLWPDHPCANLAKEPSAQLNSHNGQHTK